MFFNVYSDIFNMRSSKSFFNLCDKLIQQKGLTRAELCRKIGISPAAFNMSEKRESYFSIETLCDISDLLNIPLDNLIDTRFARDKELSEEVREIASMLSALSEKEVGAVKILVEYLYTNRSKKV